MKTQTFVSFTLVIALTLALIAPVHAITVCYDYVYYRVTRGQDRQRLGPGAVIAAMKKEQYGELTGQQKPGLDGTRLQPGDVIIMPGHIGYANGRNSIDHYIQCVPLGSTALNGINDVGPHPAATIDQVVPGKTCKKGGFFSNASLREFLETTAKPHKHRAEDVSYQVWRKAKLVSGTYPLVFQHRGRTHTVSLKLVVSGDQLTGTMIADCCPGPRVDPLRGSISGDRVIINRDCSGQGWKGPCHQVYDGTLAPGSNVIRGSFSGTGSAPDIVWTVDLSSRTN